MSSTSRTSKNDNIMNSEEKEYDIDNSSLSNWKTPKVPISEVYKGTFKYFSNLHVKTQEETIHMRGEYQTIQLFNEKTIIKHINNGFKLLYIGLVQVATKPLGRDGLNMSLAMVLRHCRWNNFEKSMLGGIQECLYKGPVYFNLFPNYIISLEDKNIMDVLTLNIQIHNSKIKEGSLPLLLIYRIQYKVFTTCIDPKARQISPKGETLLL